MNQTRDQFDAEMCSRFPRLYADRRKPETETCMCWGFESIGPGWYGLIRDLSSKLEPLIDAWIHEHGETDHPRAAQVKEKFGELRFYMTSGTAEIWRLIEAAEAASRSTCMHCGCTEGVKIASTPARPRWILALCEPCRQADKKPEPTTTEPTP